MSTDEDDRLRVEAAQRDPARFDELYERNFHRVYAYVIRRVGDRHQAEDLTAEVFREALAGNRQVRMARRSIYRMAFADRLAGHRRPLAAQRARIGESGA